VAIDGVSSTVPWFVVTVNVCAPAAVPKEVYKASKAAPSSLMPAIDTAYFSPVIIIEVTFVNASDENGPDEGAAVTPEQFILIFFMALFVEEEKFKDPVPGDNGLEEKNKMPSILVIAGTLSVKLVKLKVFAAKYRKPVVVIDDILSDGIDSKEIQYENICCNSVTDCVLNKGTDFKE
jgi:hypothetical protein